MPFSLEDQPRMRFRRDPLKTVVWQLRFPPILALDNPAFVSGFQEAIRDSYPKAEPRGRQLSVGAGKESLGEVSVDLPPWRFRDDTGAWLIALNRDYVSLETTKYELFEDFEARLERLLEVVEVHLDPRHITRLGLRYVDNIHHEDVESPADYRRFLNEELLGVVAGEKIAPYILDAFQQIHLGVPAGELVIRHGYVSRSVNEKSPFYLIDIDAFNSEERPYERSYCLSRTREFKRQCWNFFRQSITEELVAILEPESINA